MSRPVRVNRTTTITLELVVEVTGCICPPEPDVGISTSYIYDLRVTRIGDELDTKDASGAYNIDWCPDRNTRTADWLEATIERQCKAQLEEKLLDA